MNIFNFDKLISPYIVKFIYWMGMVVLLLLALIAIMTTHTSYGDALTILGVIFVWFLSCLLWRVICEVVILQFNVFNRLTEIRDRLPSNPTTGKKAG
ncbi:DUF4282 domain-containing protein [Ochrobactrum sp. Marseille-Q0166]|uniref:DUF4282 domain-containing protein n=1 Tax=Ochrobactrum sp. Marseille-Q0166 TaxID=2761105 RepID=UPI001655B028|nr:DUF4282 domain-containing protein [Ochrobactrum sp. Marseille-Q0166]MBC8717991.1 DUF4282 domain-containing protein [Ochrobactrum sp. Marseille-Q0166]